MSSKAITETPDAPARAGDWQAMRETAPSAMRPDEPRLARWVGSVGLLCLALAGFALFFQAVRGPTAIGPGLRLFLIATGLAGLLFHAARDSDLQIRRTYGVLGFLFLGAAIVLAVLPLQGSAGAQFLPYGFLCLPLALLFLMAFARNETDQAWRQVAMWAVGLVAVALAGVGFVASNVSVNFLLPHGMLLAVTGLAYWWTFVGMLGTDSDLGYRAGWAMGAVGVLAFLVALGRSAVPPLAHSLGWMKAGSEVSYFTSGGLLLLTLGLLYAGFSVGLCSDHRLVVLTRRELAAFFYSPIAYIVLFGLTFVGACLFLMFVNTILYFSDQGQALVEPIIQYYIVAFVPVVSMLIVVPVVTMRLLSEERRTGTLEVLLTAPVDETSVVLSKFFAAWIFFMVLWIPWWLFLVALRVEGGQPFDYRPILSFLIALACSGAGFMAMGLFFSALTRNQIAAAVLSFMMMTVLLVVFFLNQRLGAGSAWQTLLTHMSFINLWETSLTGRLAPRDLMFHLSAAVFWLFLTVKVLEARKWS
jgi:hypothetical protein